MSRHQNHLRRKLRSALHALRLAGPGPDRIAVTKAPPVENFYAREGDGHVLIAVHQRPRPGIAGKIYAGQWAMKATMMAALSGPKTLTSR